MTGVSRLESALPKSLAERLAELFYDDEEISAYNIRQIREKERMAEQRAAYENADDILTAPLPGGNPEVPTAADALVGALMSMGGVPPRIARSGNTFETKRPAGHIKTPKSTLDNPYQIGSLAERVEGKLYRETSPERAMEFMPKGPMTQTQYDDMWMATHPELALGQGSNRGVTLEINPSGLQGAVSRAKPASEMLAQQGRGEILGRYNPQQAYINSLDAFTIRPTASGRRSEMQRLRTMTSALEQQGWTKIVNPDGSVTYRKPGTSPESLED